MNEQVALQIITELSFATQEKGMLTLDQAVSVKQMLDFVTEKFTIKEEVKNPAK